MVFYEYQQIRIEKANLDQSTKHRHCFRWVAHWKLRGGVIVQNSLPSKTFFFLAQPDDPASERYLPILRVSSDSGFERRWHLSKGKWINFVVFASHFGLQYQYFNSGEFAGIFWNSEVKILLYCRNTISAQYHLITRSVSKTEQFFQSWFTAGLTVSRK